MRDLYLVEKRGKLNRTLQNLLNAPTLAGAEGTTLLDEDPISSFAGVLLIVSVVPLTTLDVLGVDGVAHTTRHLDHDGLLHLVASD
jgi:hypothetical protein